LQAKGKAVSCKQREKQYLASKGKSSILQAKGKNSAGWHTSAKDLTPGGLMRRPSA
jgi:hypothetical protein